MEIDLIFLHSLSAERLYPKWNDEAPNLWTESGIPKLLSLQYGDGRVEVAQRPFVEKCLEKRLPRTGRGDDESRAFRIAFNTEHFRPKILVEITALAEQFYSRI